MEMRAVTGGRRCWRGALALVLAPAAVPCAAQVGPLTYQSLFFNQGSNTRTGDYLAADAGLVYTDNASFAGNGAGDTLAEIGLVGNTAYQGPRLDYHLDSDIAAVKYLHGTYPLEPTGYLDGSADLKLLPGLFSWTGRETYSQLVINPYLPATPDNLENVNTITTGPRFILRPTLRTTVTLDGIYTYLSTHSNSPLYVNIDNHRFGGELRIERAFSSASSLYIKGDYEKVLFNDPLINSNFIVASETVGYKIETGRTLLDVSGGYTELRELHVLVPVETVVGIVQRPMTRRFGTPNWSLMLSRVLTPAERLEIFASQQVLDAANLFQADLAQAVPSIAVPQVATGDPVINRVFGANWRLQAARTTLDVGLLDTRQRYEVDSAQNRDLKDVSALVDRQLGPALNWDIGVRFERQELTGGRAVNASTEITDLRWQVGQRLGLRFLYTHSRFAAINDNQVGVLVSYMLLGGRPAAGRSQNPLLEPALSPYGLQPVSPLSTLPPPR